MLTVCSALAVLGALAPAAQALPAFRGVNMHSLWLGDQDMDRELDLARELGSNVVRIDVGWQLLEENGKGQITGWYLNRLDRFVAGAHARDMKVVLILMLTPCWASSAPEELKDGCSHGWWERGVGAYPPSDARDYADVARFLVHRYGDRLVAFEIWNEPNLRYFFNAADPAAAYANLVKAAYPAVKQASPHVRVLAGSLSHSDRPFLESLYANGIRGHYDAISVHPYNENSDPDAIFDERWRKQNFLPGLRWLREGMLAAGDTAPVWADELGWHTASTRGEPAPWRNGVDEATQGRYLARAMSLLGAESAGLGFVEGGVAYDLRDDGTDPTNIEHNFGVVRRDYSPKASFSILRDAFAGSPGDDQPAPPVKTPSTSLRLVARARRGRVRLAWQVQGPADGMRFHIFRRRANGTWPGKPIATVLGTTFFDRRAGRSRRKRRRYVYRVIAEAQAAGAPVLLTRRSSRRGRRGG